MLKFSKSNYQSTKADESIDFVKLHLDILRYIVNLLISGYTGTAGVCSISISLPVNLGYSYLSVLSHVFPEKKSQHRM